MREFPPLGRLAAEFNAEGNVLVSHRARAVSPYREELDALLALNRHA